jgi:Mrp family chromosome partitioning ATPase
VNDPDQTMSFPVIEVSSESNGASPRKALPPRETIIPPRERIIPPKDAVPSRPVTGSQAEPLHFEPFRFEPTVFGAIWRYRFMVIALAILGLVVGIGYSLKPAKIYRSQASITVPQQVSLQGAQADAGQYLDSQVLLLQSETVAQLAAKIANSTLHSKVLSTSNFFGVGSSLEISPPTTAAPGAYGATVVSVSFGGPTPQIAQVGTNAVLQAYDQTREATVKSQDNAVITGLSNAIGATNFQLTSLAKQGVSVYTQSLQQQLLTQRAALINQRTQAVVNEQIDLAQQPSQTTATLPGKPANHKWSLDGGAGLIFGFLIGSAIAYARDARRRRKIADRQDPAPIYGVPLVGEIPAFDATRTRRRNGTAVDGLLPVVADPRSAAAEAFRFAAGSVERIRATVPDQTLSVAFVAPNAGAGKSTVVANIALALAEGGARVLVVDADAGELAARLLPHDASVTAGLEQVLSGQQSLAECVRPSQVNSAVAVLGPGSLARGRVMGVARSAAMATVLTEAKESYDVVLIDSPALLQVADATEMVAAANRVIVVVSVDEPVRDHRDMVSRLRLIGVDLLGYIYNQASTRPSRRTFAATVHAPGQPSTAYRRSQPLPASQLTPTVASTKSPPHG